MSLNTNSDGVAFIYSPNLVSELDKIPKIQGRAKLVNSLIGAYGLYEHLKIVNPMKADEKILKTFHSQDYINFIKNCSTDNEDLGDYEDVFGLGYDCPVIDQLFEFCSIVGGASVTAAHLINTNTFKYAINWFGGWHHSKRDKASGFCYVNDIVLCILKLRQRFNRILYIDMDLHHGDGVQEAFEFTNKVFTLSFHKWAQGFFPGTGSLEESGQGSGKFFTANVPLQSGITDSDYTDIFSKVFKKILEVFRPEVIVLQCGADSLFGDPIDSSPFNLTTDGYCNCIQMVLDTKLPVVFLGGGGYNFSNTARLWCLISSMIANVKLKNDIPEHDNFLDFGPNYEIKTSCGYLKNKNSKEQIEKILDQIFRNLSCIKFE